MGFPLGATLTQGRHILESPPHCRNTHALAVQILGFSVRRHSNYQVAYDFGQLTTVAWNTDPALVCVAHQHGTRVVINAGIGDLRAFQEATERAAWIKPLVQQALDHCLDGVNFDFEGPIPAGFIPNALPLLQPSPPETPS